VLSINLIYLELLCSLFIRPVESAELPNVAHASKSLETPGLEELRKTRKASVSKVSWPRFELVISRTQVVASWGNLLSPTSDSGASGLPWLVNCTLHRPVFSVGWLQATNLEPNKMVRGVTSPQAPSNFNILCNVQVSFWEPIWRSRYSDWATGWMVKGSQFESR
jgi:hypothetical protein